MTHAMNLSLNLRWAALAAGHEGREVETQHGTVRAVTIDVPLEDIALHDAECDRWDATREYLGLVIDELFEDAAREAKEAMRAEALRELAALNAPDPEDEPEQGFTVKMSRNGRYAIGNCERCTHVASGMMDEVTVAMETHVQTHAKKATPKVVEVPVAKETPAKVKPRCEVHGVWAREDDGRCKRCDVPEVSEVATQVAEALKVHAAGSAQPATAGDTLTQVLTALIAAKAQPAPKQTPATQVTHATTATAGAKITLGVRGNGNLARRSAHALAELTGVSQRELTKLTQEQAHALVAEHGIDATWVPAAQL